MDLDNINKERLFEALKSSKEGVLEKSLIDDLTYSKNAIEISKTGKELKVLLSKVKVSLEAAAEECKSKMTIKLSLLSSIGSKQIPSGNPSSYLMGGIRATAFSYLPKLFSYEQKYPKDSGEVMKEPYAMGGSYDSSDLTKMGSVPTVDTAVKVRQCMNDYNDCAREYIRKTADKLFIEGIVNSLSDKASVKLSGQMLKLLV